MTAGVVLLSSQGIGGRARTEAEQMLLHNRNLEMTVLSMKGYSGNMIGQVFKLTPTRVCQIVLREANRELGREYKDRLDIRSLRKRHKNRLITDLRLKIVNNTEEMGIL